MNEDLRFMGNLSISSMCPDCAEPLELDGVFYHAFEGPLEVNITLTRDDVYKCSRCHKWWTYSEMHEGNYGDIVLSGVTAYEH